MQLTIETPKHKKVKPMFCSNNNFQLLRRSLQCLVLASKGVTSGTEEVYLTHSRIYQGERESLCLTVCIAICSCWFFTQFSLV